jgi:hydroxymethylbilane synthase
MLPAVGQGALGLECRSNDEATRAALEGLNDPATRQAVLAERAFLRAMGGGCQVPMGAAAVVRGRVLALRAAVLRPDGTSRLEAETSGDADAAERIGQSLAEQLLERGARTLLAAERGT